MNNLNQELAFGIVSDQTILEAESKLTPEEFSRYTFMVDSQKKNEVVAWLLWIFLGQFQVHMFYLGLFDDRHLKVLRIVGLVLLYFLIGGFIIVPLWIYDAVKMSSYMRECNNLTKAKILAMFIKEENPTEA